MQADVIIKEPPPWVPFLRGGAGLLAPPTRTPLGWGRKLGMKEGSGESLEM